MKSGYIIASLRYKKGITQSDLAKQLGVTKGTVGMWETNKRTPTLDKLLLLCEYFDVTSDYLLGLSDQPKPSPEKENTDDTTNDMLKIFKELDKTNRYIVLGHANELLKEQQKSQ